MENNARNLELPNLIEILRDEAPRKFDITVPAGALQWGLGNLLLFGIDPALTDAGVTPLDGEYTPTQVAIEGLASRLGAPGLTAGYLRGLRSELPALFDATVEQWTAWADDRYRQARRNRPTENLTWMLRVLTGKDGQPGTLRAITSDRYRVIDNLDVLMAALGGVREGGVTARVDSADLTDRRMYVRISAPEIREMAPNLLRGYRSPFDTGIATRAGDLEHWRGVARREGMGYAPGAEPIVFAGLEIRNSETGEGSYSITPRITVQICKNGLQVPVDAMRSRHLGARVEQGVVQASSRTQDAALELIKNQTADAVRTFLSPEYLRRKVDEVEAVAGTPVGDSEKTIKAVGSALRIGQKQQEEILRHFIAGGQMTAGGVAQAITSTAQTLSDADMASEFEQIAIRAMGEAARVNA